MENIVKELGIHKKNIHASASYNLFNVVVHNCWLKKLIKNKELDCTVNNVDFILQPGENVPHPWRKIFIRVLHKKVSKVLPLPRYKLNEGSNEFPLTFSQLLQYVSQTNQRNLWKQSYKNYCHNQESNKEKTVVNLLEHDQLLSEILSRFYGCNIIRIKNDETGKILEFNETVPTKYSIQKSYESHVNLLAALFIIETDQNYFIVYRGHYENNLLDCLNFSPNLIDLNYTRGLFIIYQLLNAVKGVSDRGLSIGQLNLQDIYLTENLWLQILPAIKNNVHSLDATLIQEHRSKSSAVVQGSQGKRDESCWRNKVVELEKLCTLWVKGQISNLDYLLHLNVLAGRQADDPQTHFLVPWVTDFVSRCGRNWRDLSKSKYRLNKGDQQLDLTYDVAECVSQIPHHVTDALSDITCYVYLARRTPKETLCKHVRNKWVPAEYPASIQRLQEWSPDECIPEFYTDPTVFKSIHEDMPDLGIPTWATCVEDFISKHREALESTHVSENLHHWIDITFGYKLSGCAAVKAKNVCLSLVDGHTAARRGAPVQVFAAPHPPRRAPRAAPPAPPRLHWTAPRDNKKAIKSNDSSEEISDEEEESTSLPQHVSRLSTPSQRVRSRNKSSSRARSLSKSQGQGQEDSQHETRASSHSRHYRVQRSELGKGVIYLPKEFNPIAPIQALECMDNFRTKCFFSKADTTETNIPIKRQNKANESLDDTAFTNQLFDASYEGKLSNESHLESVLKEKKNRSFNTRFTTDAAVYKQIITDDRNQDMLVVGCLMVEIFLYNYMRPLRTNSDDFVKRYDSCRIVLKYNYSSLPKCVSYVASLLLNVEPPSLSFRNELTPKTLVSPKQDETKVVTDKGLPSPSPSQLLQPLLMQHLIPFPQSFNTLYKLLSTLHEYELATTELNILYTYQCDGVQCEKYQNVDKTKLYFNQKIAEGKIHACVVHLETLINQITSSNQFDVLNIFFTHYIELLQNKDTSVLAAWYLFDTVSKALGPAETTKKLLKPILNLYDDDDFVINKSEHKLTDFDSLSSSRVCKQKFLKLYHNIFLLQLMVRFGLQCFLDNFTQHLVEAVGGYKDVNNEVSSPGHICGSVIVTNKKPRYSDDTVKNALSITNDGNIFSPDTSYGSEHIVTPNIETKTNIEPVLIEPMKEKDADTRSENELFHFESDKEGLNPSRSSRSKSPADSIESYTLNPQETLNIHSPSTDIYSPTIPKDFSPSIRPSSAKELNLTINKEYTPIDNPKRGPMSPTIDIPSKNSMFTSYLHFAHEDTEDVELRKETHSRQIKSLELNRNVELSVPKTSRSFTDDMNQNIKDMEPCKISDMSSESLIWLAHRLGPVLTCRFITRNLLKMLTLCYIGKDNLAPWNSDENDEFDDISIANSKVVGDKNAMKVIKCLTAIVAMYGEQLIIFQYLPHMGELIASCRRRLTVPLEGGVVACLQLLKYLIPYMSDAKVMEQLQDTFLKSILQPVLRLCATSRCACPSGTGARRALAAKLLDALHALALRVGPEMTRNHLAGTTLMRFFLAFDKATGKIDNWPKQEENVTEKVCEGSSVEGCEEGFLEICRDGSTAEWAVRGGRVVRADLPDLPCSPPDHPPDQKDAARLTAQEELLIVFNEELAYQAYSTFAKFIGTEAMERNLKNMDTIQAMYQKYEQNNSICSPLRLSRLEKRVQSSLSDEPLNRKVIDATPTKPELEHMTYSNSFGSNVTLVGNRIDVNSDNSAGGCSGQGRGFDVVAYKGDNGVKSSRHLRGDWLIYWEHEIGRPEKENRFNLKQIKLQTFVGHTHSVKSIHCLDNENSFMSGSKDKTVRLWSLRNQGDGNATSQCNWSYTGHKKGVLSLAFIESQRLAVSTDSVVHIWDPFMESVVSQLDNIKSGVSIVRALPGPSAAVLAATTDGTLKIIDARACNYTHDLKVPMSATTFIRCMCTSDSGAWVCVGLASGHVALLDVRTGAPRRTWRAHDGEVLRVAAVDERRVLSSGLDQTTALWSADDGELIAHLKGTTEPVHCLSVYYNELISGTTNNRIGVHTSLDQDASFSSTKLRSDTFRGVLTCMSVLSLNRLLLLGSDNGTISLLC